MERRNTRPVSIYLSVLGMLHESSRNTTEEKVEQGECGHKDEQHMVTAKKGERRRYKVENQEGDH